MRKNLLFLLLSLSTQCFAQWDSCGVTNGLSNPNILTVNSFINHQGRLFADVSSRGLIYSDDQGDNWTAVNGTFNGAISYLWEAHGKLYASTAINGVLGGLQYYSADNGQNWTVDTAGMPRSALNANFPATVIKAQTLGDYIFYQFNIPNAFQWRHKDSSVYHIDAASNINQLSGFHIDQDTLWGILQGRPQYVTQARGAFTAPSNNNLPIIASSHVFKDGSYFYIVAWDSNLDEVLYRSFNSGNDWDTIYLQSYLGQGAFGLKRRTNTLFADGANIWLGPQSKGQGKSVEIFSSSDAGRTWTIDSNHLPTDPFGTNAVRVFQKDQQNIYAALNFRDVFKKGFGGSIEVIENPIHQISIFPNPSRGILKVEASFKVKRIEVLTLRGVQTTEFLGLQEIDLGFLSPGIYLLKIEGINGESAVSKLQLLP